MTGKWGGNRKGAGRPIDKPKNKSAHKVVFVLGIKDWQWLVDHAKKMKTSVSTVLRHAVQILRDGS